MHALAACCVFERREPLQQHDLVELALSRDMQRNIITLNRAIKASKPATL